MHTTLPAPLIPVSPITSPQGVQLSSVGSRSPRSGARADVVVGTVLPLTESPVPEVRSFQVRRGFYQRLVNQRRTLESDGDPEFLEPPQVVRPMQFLWEFVTVQGDHPVEKTSRLTAVLGISAIMVGSTIWTIPWAFQSTGFWGGVVTVSLVALVAQYTAAKVAEAPNPNNSLDMAMLFEPFSRPGKWLTSISAVAIMAIAVISYVMLMSGALFYLGWALLDVVFGGSAGPSGASPWSSHNTLDFAAWNPSYAALLGVLVVLPVASMRKFTILARLSVIAYLSLLYSVFFIVITSIWNIFDPGSMIEADACPNEPPAPDSVWPPGHSHHSLALRIKVYLGNFIPSLSWVVLAGIGSVGLILHNAMLPFVRSHPSPAEHFQTDLALAYLLVSVFYILLGSVGSFGFLGQIQCQDFLYQFNPLAPLAVAARIALVLQLLLVLPMLLYIQRQQCLGILRLPEWPGYLVVLGLNLVWLGLGLGFVMFFNRLGTFQQFSGAIFGGFLMYIAPILLFWQGKFFSLERWKLVVGCLIMIVGSLVLLLQFFA